MRHVFEELFARPFIPQKLSFLMAGGTDTTLLAREGQDRALSASLALQARKTTFMNPAVQVLIDGLFDHGAQVAECRFETILVNLQEGFEMVRQGAIRDSALRPSRPIQLGPGCRQTWGLPASERRKRACAPADRVDG